VNNFFESYVGLGLQETKISREDLFVQSKFVSLPHHKPFSPPYPKYEGDDAYEACHLSLLRSLEHLQTPYIDAFLVNAPEITLKPMLSLLSLLQKLKEQGLVRYTGLCNIATVDILMHLHQIVPGAIDIVQNPIHSPWDPEYKIHQYCRKNGIQYNNFHTLTSSDRIVKGDVLKNIAADRRIAPEVAFLQYCVQSGITPLVGARSQKNLLSSYPIANGDLEPLQREHMRAISRQMAEQSIINRYRGATLLERRQKELRKEQGREKMKADQGKQMQETIAQREAQEQEIVDKAKDRAKALAAKFRAEVEEQAAQEEKLENELRDRLRRLPTKTEPRRSDQDEAEDSPFPTEEG
jgi:diketogulonate reductase-like aldo/keto reductase